MAASDLAVTLAAVIEWEAPDGAVRLADGGIAKFDTGTGAQLFDVFDPRFGTVAAFDVFETGIGDVVEGGEVAFFPPFEAAVSDWWRGDLEGSRFKIWFGEVGSDGVTIENADLVADWLVDTCKREQGEAADLLTIEFMTRLQKLFEVSQGNVCSDRFHQSIWNGERGFENCHDGPQYFAWGTEAPPAPSASFNGGGGGGSGGGGGAPFPNVRLF